MRRKHLFLVAAVAILIALPLGAANENINYADLAKIKAEGMQRSQVMEINSWLADVYAPRLTGSPTALKAAEWIVAKMKEWGISNAKIEPWQERYNFDRGWTNDKFYMAAVSPERFAIPGTPTAWTPGTNGLQSGEVVLVDPAATTEEALAAYKGKLKGKWILTQAIPDVAAYWDPLSRRYTDDQLAAMQVVNPPQGEFGVTRPTAQLPGGGRGGFGMANVRNEFFRTEGALGLISTAPRGHGIYTIGGNRQADPATTLPGIVIPAEQYGRLGRMLAKKVPVTIEADIKSTYYPNPQLFNVVAEIPGSDPALAGEVVLLGAHLDTWHAATGAADDGNGVAAMMEALRILKTTGVKLRRTVRVGFWEAEEQGLIGSREYVRMHYATAAGRGGGPGGAGAPGGRQGAPGAPPAAGAQAAGGRQGAPGAQAAATPPAGAPAPGGRGGFGGPTQPPTDVKPEYNKFCVYLNIDNGTGALRGIYTQGNEAVVPIFKEWMEPFRSLGMTTVTTRNTSGTDHQSFDAVGLPGFQFIQDEIEYNTVVHHTNLDTYERLQPRDNMQMATIVAGWAYLAANRDEKLPRKPLAPRTGTN
ncbi:MAG: M20/M25/M40 family metallo-hydrolase [Bacteroidales bacterium]